jgi:probable phosphoglycerate mutase
MTETLFSGLESPAPETQEWHTAFCDGGSRGNPGPAGFGAVIQDGHGRVVARLSGYLGRQTNNFAEYKGLLAVLTWVLEHGVTRLRVVSDSELMVKQMKGQYKVASPGLRPLWEEAKRLSKALEKFEMRHTLRGGNQEADRLANEAMDQGMGKSPGGAGGNSAASRPVSPPAKATRQVFEGLVKNGVVHLIEGELPDGVLVKVIRSEAPLSASLPTKVIYPGVTCRMVPSIRWFTSKGLTSRNFCSSNGS